MVSETRSTAEDYCSTDDDGNFVPLDCTPGQVKSAARSGLHQKI